MNFKLVLRNLRAHPMRSTLTLLSVTLAVFLLCILQAVVSALESTVSMASKERLWVQSAVSLFVDLPLAYESKIAAAEGVAEVSKWQWFGGEFRDEPGFFAQFGVDVDRFAAAYPEMEVFDGSYEDFAASRQGCLIGASLAEQFGWKVGDTAPIVSEIFTRADGSAWEFVVKGIYRVTTPSLDENTLFFDFEYLQQAREQGEVFGPMGTSVYLVEPEPGADATAVMASVDKLFENGPQRVQTTTEAEFNRQFVSMLGNVPLLLRSIGAAVLFAIFFAILNTMLMAARERTRDVGVLKALGFTDRFVMLGLTVESLLLCVLGGAVGIGLAMMVAAPMGKVLASTVPGFGIPAEIIVLGGLLSVLLGLVAGIVPAWKAGRLQPVQALRAEN